MQYLVILGIDYLKNKLFPLNKILFIFFELSGIINKFHPLNF
jgi:hypothetical protein